MSELVRAGGSSGSAEHLGNRSAHTRSGSTPHRVGAWLLAAIPVVLGAAAYWPIVLNYFYIDDFLQLYQIENFGFVDTVLTPYKDHFHPTRNAIFFACAKLFGVHPAPYYAVAVGTHLLNVWLLFGLLERLTASARLACFGAALWAISPLHEATLGWYSVFGHALLATVLLIILRQAVAAAAARRQPRRRELWLWYALALMAATSFGTGVGIAMALPFALRLLRPAGSAAGRVPPLISLLAVVPALYALVFLTSQDPSGSQALDGVSAMSATKLKTLLLYFAHLIASGLTPLLLGACGITLAPRGVWYAVFVAFALVLTVALRRSAAEPRRRMAAFGLLLAASYGTIALGRGIFLPENLPLDGHWAMSAMLARYHYVGQLLLTVLVCVGLSRFAAARSDRTATVLLVLGLALPITSHMRCGIPHDHRPEARRQTEEALGAMRAAIAAQPRGHDVYIDNRLFPHVRMPPTLFPGWAAVFIAFFPDDTVDGRRVYFVEPDPATRAAAAHGRRTATLLVPSR